ncbi:hypothetical protein GF339_17790 [candidate division KSB3 bacterium]|uniref:FlgO domain-containing protein n=1 Tax=candidate division KSB3 bacterium TaxID=2044937 RepID=A0A9D5JZ56_9BACT|nr:hypothetical protein [candidate division KSB3 bacterium]MBD3326441.1 hypothetical protein [candidate division KSB3 bacterium]
MGKTHLRCIRPLLLFCLLLLVLPDTPAFAKRWYEYYLEAQDAAKEERWEVAAELLQEAINQEPEPGRRKRTYGIRSIKYFPYLALGRAYLSLGDYEAAVQACEEADRYGAAPQPLIKKCLQAAANLSSDPMESPDEPSSPSDQRSTLPRNLPTGEEIKVAVLNFQSILVAEELGIAVAEIFRTEIVGLGNYTVIERGMIEQVLKEQELQLTGTVDSETAVEIGKLVGAKFVVIGSIVKTGKVYTINSRLIDVETGIVKIGENIQGHGEDEIPEMVHKLSLQMIRNTKR